MTPELASSTLDCVVDSAGVSSATWPAEASARAALGGVFARVAKRLPAGCDTHDSRIPSVPAPAARSRRLARGHRAGDGVRAVVWLGGSGLRSGSARARGNPPPRNCCSTTAITPRPPRPPKHSWALMPTLLLMNPAGRPRCCSNYDVPSVNRRTRRGRSKPASRARDYVDFMTQLKAGPEGRQSRAGGTPRPCGRRLPGKLRPELCLARARHARSRTGWTEHRQARRSLEATLKLQPDHLRARVARARIDYIVDTKMPWGTGWVLGGGNKKRAMTVMREAAVALGDCPRQRRGAGCGHAGARTPAPPRRSTARGACLGCSPTTLSSQILPSRPTRSSSPPRAARLWPVM